MKFSFNFNQEVMDNEILTCTRYNSRNGGDKYKDYIALQEKVFKYKQDPDVDGLSKSLNSYFREKGMTAVVQIYSSQVMRNSSPEAKRKLINIYLEKELNKTNYTATPKITALLDDGWVLTNEEFEAIQSRKINLSIFHHNDMDGEASAAFTFMAFATNQTEYTDNIRFYRYNYKLEDMNRHLQNIEKYTPRGKKKYAIVVDLSLTTRDLKELLKHFDKVVWLDHHYTSTEVGLKVSKIIPEGKKFSMIIDTRESSAYCCYSLFKDDIANVFEGYDGVDSDSLNTLLPALISIYDTKQDIKYPQLYKVAEALNQYYFDMPYTDHASRMWRTLLINRKVETSSELLIEENPSCPFVSVIRDGIKLRQVDELKKDVMYDGECKYHAKLSDRETPGKVNAEIIGLIGNGPANRIRSNIDNLIKLVIRIDQLGVITTSAYSDSLKVRGPEGLNLGKVFSEVFGGGGHPGAAGFNIPLSDFERIIEHFKKNREIDYSSMTFDVIDDGNWHRLDETVQYVFNSVSMVLLYTWDNLLQE